MRVGSLFTGYGGLDMAVGGDLAWYAEIEPAACQVLEAHYPNVPNLGDIKAIDWSTVEPVDILTGGYPCQPFSHAGSRKGKNDERHLWPYVRDAIYALRPRYAILENVSGHLTLGLADVLSDLTQIGFNAEWGTYRASDIGAPHRRERVFIIAHASRGARGTGAGRCDPESERSTGSPAHVSHLVTDTVDIGLQQSNVGLRPKLGISATTGHSGPATDNRTTTNGNTNSIDVSEIRQVQVEGADSGRICEVNAGQSANWGKYAQAITRWERLTRPAPDPTYQRGERQRLNPAFVEWMMGLPEGHVTGHGLSTAKQLKMLGNGVVPQQAAAAISQLMERTA
jgi:DNA (cytosine-5)-methyltransferase 1